jgi:hypothetical protein
VEIDFSNPSPPAAMAKVLNEQQASDFIIVPSQKTENESRYKV